MPGRSDYIVSNKNLAIANRSRGSCAQYVEGIYRPKYYTVTLMIMMMMMMMNLG